MESLDLFGLLMGLFGGLALFLLGMEQMAGGLKAVAGDRMKTVLAKLTTNRFAGVATGAFVTAIIQSSSVTTVLVVGFVTAGLMTVSQSIGVIMGANIGTTMTAQIVAFKVTKYALLLVAVGFGLSLAGKRESLQKYGTMLMGLGLVFFGMAVMGEAMEPLRAYPPFLDMMKKMANPALGILMGAGFTALVQSSSATTAIVIVLATQGFITLPAGIALAMGANIGTCVTALLATIGKPREAVRAALVHVVFNIAGVLLWVGLIDQMVMLVKMISPASEGLAEIDRLAADAPRQIANAHTFFNVANTAIFIWFTRPLAKLVYWLVPERAAAEDDTVRPRYLNESLISSPSLALSNARMEMGELGSHVRAMMAAILPAALTGTAEKLRAVARMDQAVDALHAAIIDFLRKVGLNELSPAESEEMISLMEVANSFESIGDLIETDLVHLGERRISERVDVSEVTRGVIREFHAAVAEAVDLAVLAATQKDQEAAARVVDMKDRITRLGDAAAHHCAKRLVAAEPNRLIAYTRETEMIEKLKRIYYFAKRIAKSIHPEAEAAPIPAAEPTPDPTPSA